MKKSAAKKRKATLVRRALVPTSPLLALVQDGIGAVEKSHRDYIDPSLRSEFEDSLEIDASLKKGHEQENRWDYLLGHGPTTSMIALEPHSAKDEEVTTIIKKRRSAREQLQPHLNDGAKIVAWLWVASGKVKFAATEKAQRQLDQHGIKFVGTQLKRKHLTP